MCGPWQITTIPISLYTEKVKGKNVLGCFRHLNLLHLFNEIQFDFTRYLLSLALVVSILVSVLTFGLRTLKQILMFNNLVCFLLYIDLFSP